MLDEINEIELAISESKISEAIDVLKKVFSISKSDNYNEVLILSGRYKKLKAQIRKGIISKEQQDLEYNKIVDHLLELKDEIAEEEAAVEKYVDLKSLLDVMERKL